MAGTPFGREKTRAVILRASYYAALFIRENRTHTFEHGALHTRTEIISAAANTSCSVAHQLQEKLSNVRSLAEQHTNERNPLGSQRASYLIEVGSGSLKSHTNTMRDDFSTHSVETSPETSVAITLSHVVMYMPCDAAMVTWPQMSCWSSKRGGCKDAVDFAFVAELFPWFREEAVHWFPENY